MHQSNETGGGKLSRLFLQRFFRKFVSVGQRKREDIRRPFRKRERLAPTSQRLCCSPARSRRVSIIRDSKEKNFAEDDFWGEVLRRSTQSPSAAFDSFCEAKVGYLGDLC